MKSLLGCFVIFTAFLGLPVAEAGNASHNKVIDHWNAERQKAASPRDLVIDHRGLGYLRGRGGALIPYGHSVKAETPVPNGKPGGGDTTPPDVTDMDPAQGSSIGSSYTFSATITDDSGIKSVSFVIEYPDGSTTQSFSPSFQGNGVWSIDLQGFSDGNWRWWVVAKDTGDKGGNTRVSEAVRFAVGGSVVPPDSGDTVTNAAWSYGGDIQSASGRIYFEMPSNPKWKRWNGYVCSGTVVVDGVTGRSVILTAAHCVYDDANKAFARNVLFIPNQDQTTGSGTDTNCNNDPIGCWTTSYGVVDVDWTTRTFPDNIPWDYAYYVVSDQGAHSGSAAASDALDVATSPLMVSYASPYVDDGEVGSNSLDFTYALGYSYSDDPNFMHCAEDMTTEGASNWWLPSCGLSGGASGGAWVQPMDLSTGSGSIISVNSWGYTTSPGMAGPKLNGTSAQCLFSVAAIEAGPATLSDGEAGLIITCP